MYFIGVQLKMYIISSGIFKEVLPLNSGFIQIVLWKLGFNFFYFFFFSCKKIVHLQIKPATTNFIFLLFQLSSVQSKAGSYGLLWNSLCNLQERKHSTLKRKFSFVTFYKAMCKLYGLFSIVGITIV